jgi:hypothetical protein
MILGAKKAGTTSLYEYMELSTHCPKRDAKRTAWTGGGMINAKKQQRVEGNGVTVLLRGRLATSSQPPYRFYAELSFGQSARHPPIARSVQLEDEVHCHATKSSRAESHYAMVTSTKDGSCEHGDKSGEKSRFGKSSSWKI